MGKELLFSRANDLGISTFDITIWDNSLLLKILRLLSTYEYHSRQVQQIYSVLIDLLDLPYQWDLHTASATALESLNFKQINKNLRKISDNIRQICDNLGIRFNKYGIPIISLHGNLHVVAVHVLSCQLGSRIDITDGLDPYGNWYYGDNSFGYSAANRCYQVSSVGVNPYAIRDELLLFARSLSYPEASLAYILADSYLYNDAIFFLRHRLVSYQIAWQNHVVAFAFYMPFGREHGYVMFCNRSNAPGSTNFLYIGEKNQVISFFRQFQDMAGVIDHDVWQHLIVTELEDTQRFQRISLSSKSLKRNNCAYGNPKSLVLASLCVLYLESGMELSLALHSAHSLYKRYTKFARLNCVYVLIARYEYAQYEIERKMLRKIACKILLYYQRKFGWEHSPPEVKYVLNHLISKIFGNGTGGLDRIQQVLLLGTYEPYHRNNLLAKLRA